jgi:hypothetical protein
MNGYCDWGQKMHLFRIEFIYFNKITLYTIKYMKAQKFGPHMKF